MKMILNQFMKLFIVPIIFIFISFLFIKCESSEKLRPDFSSVPLDIQIDRFDKEFFNSRDDEIVDLKNKYPFFFPKEFDDSIWLKRKNDPLLSLLNSEINKVFFSDKVLKTPIEKVFKHIKYYFPNYKIPKVITVSNNVDYLNKVILNDSLLIISIDTYLGNKNKIYNGIPSYLVEQMDIKYLSSNILDEFLIKIIPKSNERSFISKIINHGKKLFLKDLLIPNLKDEIKIGYTQSQFKWAKENELFIWRFFVQNEFLFSTNPSLEDRFINPSPFSKFYLEIDNLSPGKIGQWIGWKIVRSFMEKNKEISISDLINISESDIYINSNYKPFKQ